MPRTAARMTVVVIARALDEQRVRITNGSRAMSGGTAPQRLLQRSTQLAALVLITALAVPSVGSASLPIDDNGGPAHGSAARSPGQAHGGAAGRPDIVVLVIDDLGDMDRRVFERLPAIRDRFLRSGIEFTDYVGNDPLCCPGRATLLSGQRSGDHGVVINDPGLHPGKR